MTPLIRLRRSLAALLTAALLLGVLALAQPAAGGAGPARAARFTDVPPEHPFAAEIEWLVSEDIASGFPDGTFGPTLVISRQAMASMLFRYSGDPVDPNACETAPFPDVPTDHLFCAEIEWLSEQEITDGFPDGTFRPTATITRQAVAALLYRLGGSPDGLDPACIDAPFDDVAIDHAFCAEIDWLAREDIGQGYADGTFGPGRAVARQSFASFLFHYDAWAPLPSAGCGSSTTGAVVEENRTIQVDAVERWYLLTTPTAHDGETPVPLVLDFHGLAEGAGIHTAMSEFSPIAEREGFAVAFPNGTGDPVRWNLLNDPTNPDVVYVDAMLDELGADLCIDLRRVYASGLSMGAMMNSLLACTSSERFAAVAPVAGLNAVSPCQATRPVPVIATHGTADPILPFNGNSGLPVDLNGPGYPANVAAWAARNGCDPVATDIAVTDEVIQRVYDCPDDADVEFFIVLGGGHAWPGSAFSQAIAAVVGYTTFDIDASEEAWAFFQRFHL